MKSKKVTFSNTLQEIFAPIPGPAMVCQYCKNILTYFDDIIRVAANNEFDSYSCHKACVNKIT
jgi:hypothetical protein